MLTPDTILLNRYRIVRQLGKGGMGAVYEAVDLDLSCHVAIKETFAEAEHFRRFFKREACLLANLRHAALPKVMHHFTLKNGHFLVMEYIPGEDLMQMLQKHGGAFFPADVLYWADGLLDALGYLHRFKPHPIIHRDIKPANIKLTTEGQIILLDFGLAKGKAGEMSSVNSNQTIIGYTPGYAPLEQVLPADQRWIEVLCAINEREVRQIYQLPSDARSDLFSLGATLYHLMTNQKPHDAPTRAVAVWSGRPDPLLRADELNSQVTPAIADVLTRALSLNRDDRFATAAEMRKALREASQAPFSLRETGGLNASDSPTYVDPVAPTSPEIATESTLPATTQAIIKYGILGTCDGAVRSVAFAPNGKWVASGSNDNVVRIWDVQTGEARILGQCDLGDSGFSYISTIAFAPDSQAVASGSNDKIVRLWDVQTGEGRILGKYEQQIRVISYSPKGGELAAGGDDGTVYLLDVQTGPSRVIGRCEGIIWAIAFAPDGRSVAAESDDGTIRIWDIDTLQVQTLNSQDHDVRSLAFSRDGRPMASGCGDHRNSLWDIQTNEALILGNCDDVVRSIAFSPGGRSIASASDDKVIRVWDIPTGQAHLLGSCDDVASAVAFSPDNRSVASGSWDSTIRVWRNPIS